MLPWSSHPFCAIYGMKIETIYCAVGLVLCVAGTHSPTQFSTCVLPLEAFSISCQSPSRELK